MFDFVERTKYVFYKYVKLVKLRFKEIALDLNQCKVYCSKTF